MKVMKINIKPTNKDVTWWDEYILTEECLFPQKCPEEENGKLLSQEIKMTTNQYFSSHPNVNFTVLITKRTEFRYCTLKRRGAEIYPRITMWYFSANFYLPAYSPSLFEITWKNMTVTNWTLLSWRIWYRETKVETYKDFSWKINISLIIYK